jgi:hypothetical protein
MYVRVHVYQVLVPWYTVVVAFMLDSHRATSLATARATATGGSGVATAHVVRMRAVPADIIVSSTNGLGGGVPLPLLVLLLLLLLFLLLQAGRAIMRRLQLLRASDVQKKSAQDGQTGEQPGRSTRTTRTRQHVTCRRAAGQRGASGESFASTRCPTMPVAPSGSA